MLSASRFAPATALVFLASAATAPAALVNRYSFDGAAGAAVSGTVITDSVGGAHGTVFGAGAMHTGSGSISLPGGSGATAAYVDLPNGILSSHDTVTFEAWYTISGAQSWGRVFDFGSSAGGEVPGPGGGGEGQDYFMFAPTRGTDINLQRFEVRNFDAAAGGGGTGPVDNVTELWDTSLGSVLGQQYQIAAVWESTGGGAGQIRLYRDGVSTGAGTATTFTARDMNDVNNWLGRSNWTGDANFQGEFNEFRIWDHAFDDGFASASFAAGPGVVIPEPQVLGLISLLGVLVILRRRR